MHKHADLAHSANQNRVQRKSEECRMDENERMKAKKGHIGEREGEGCSSELTSCSVGMVLSMGGGVGGGSRSRRFAFSRESKA